jgi:hypothetical protein
MTLLHDLQDFGDLIAVTARNHAIDPGLVEKDYWIMHCLWGLQQLGFRFELKGGTSLSKGFRLIHRFSEDIDILIHPDGDLPMGRNQNKPAHVEARRNFYDGLPPRLGIPGFTGAERDHNFDDERMRSAGIRLFYPEFNPLLEGVKAGILLEAGFDQVAPNRPCLISSWAFETAVTSGLSDLTDNRAIDIACYEPGYTLVEKLQTISTKFRRHRETGEMPQNFLRHYYDVFCLLADLQVQAFIGSDVYLEHKDARFPVADEKSLDRNEAFLLSDPEMRSQFEAAYESTSALYYREQPPFAALLERLAANLHRL